MLRIGLAALRHHQHARGDQHALENGSKTDMEILQALRSVVRVLDVHLQARGFEWAAIEESADGT